MCGLTGFARPVDGDSIGVEFAQQAFTRLLRENEARGTHATGIAIHSNVPDDETFVFKVAERSSKVLASDAWHKQVLPRIDGNVLAVQGHTRHATQDNARRDDCAHPFMCGPVTGAHNGMIHNWRQLESSMRREKQMPEEAPPIKVDSQVAFMQLAIEDSPLTALARLDGYFALSWWKKRRLHLCRTKSAMLAVAYVPDLKLLLWNSQLHVMTRVLKAMGVQERDMAVQELVEETVYRFAPARFDDKAPHYITMKSPVAWGGRTASMSRAEAERLTGNDAVESKPKRKASAVIPYKPSGATNAEVDTNGDYTGQLTLRSVLGLLTKAVQRIDYLEQEMNTLTRCLQDQGISTDFGESELEARMDREQRNLFRCHECGEPGTTDNPLLDGPGGTFVHDGCIFAGSR